MPVNSTIMNNTVVYGGDLLRLTAGDGPYAALPDAFSALASFHLAVHCLLVTY